MVQPPTVPPPSDEAPPMFATAACKSCQAPIIWADTVKGGRMPVDADPVDVNSGDGSVLLHPRGHLAPLAELVSDKARLFGKRFVYRPHMQTCPYADRYRRRPGGAAAEMRIRTEEEYQILRRWAEGRSVESIRIATSMTADYVKQTLARVCRFDRDRARALVAGYQEAQRP